MSTDVELSRAREDLARLRDVQNPLEVQLRTAAIINRLLSRTGSPAVVVGGSAVSFYTGGAYLSRDIDLVTEMPGPQIWRLLEALRFARRNGAWIHTDLDVVVDFPPPPLAGEHSRVAQVETTSGPISVIGLEDLLIDRLNAAVHWGDSEAREWCVTMAALHAELDMNYLERRAHADGVADELRAVLTEARPSSS